MHGFEVQTDEITREVTRQVLFSNLPAGHRHLPPIQIRTIQFQAFQYTSMGKRFSCALIGLRSACRP